MPKSVTGEFETLTQEPRREAGGNETVLVVEDEDGLRGAICDYLKGLGYDVLAGASGEEALKIAAQTESEIGVLVTDVVMPKMSGRELAERLRTERPTISAIFMSGYIDDSVVRHGVEESHLFLQKPFKLATLAEKIRETLGTRGKN